MNNFWKILLGSLLGCLIALGLIFFIFMGSIGTMAAASASKVSAIPSSAILKIDFSNSISEKGQSLFSVSSLNNLSMDESMTALSAVRSIEKAAIDPSIKFIYLNTDNMDVSISIAEELRKALLDFRQSGKPVIAYANTYSNLSYYLASVADKVIINSYGDAMLTGVSTNIVFFKDLLDKLGVEMQLIRHGKYKAAGEQFTKNHLTDENREQNQAVVDGIWASLAEEIVASRDFSQEQLNSWVDGLELLDAESLQERGLVDQCWYTDELEDYMCDLFGVNDSKKLAFVDLQSYAILRTNNNPKAKDKIAVVYADGEIVMDGDDENIIGERLAARLTKLEKDSTVKAVVFRVNSPGGSAQAAEIINRALLNLKATKPVIASYGGYAASGGYWISANADYIFTNNTTLTGSIGVFSMIPNIGGGLEKTLKINNGSVSSNKHSDMFSSMRKLDDAEVAYMEKMVEKVYTNFTELVAEGRHMPVEKVDEIAQGRVWTGRDALQIGLADEKGGLLDAINYASAAAGIDNYKLVCVPMPMSLMEKIISKLSGFDEEINTSISEKLLKLFDDPKMLYARMPYQYEF